MSQPTSDQYETIIHILKLLSSEELNELKMRVEWRVWKWGEEENVVWQREINNIIYPGK